MARLARVDAAEGEVTGGAAQVVVDEATFVLPLEGVIDLEAERQRLTKAIAAVEKERDALGGRLGNASFVERAKPEAVEKARADHAEKAAEAARCAGEQGKYWEIHDRLFANQRALSPEQLVEHAQAVGADPVGEDVGRPGTEMVVGERDDGALEAVGAHLREELVEGCDKRLETCLSRFGNVVNFRGEPFLPGIDLLTRYPGA